MAFAESKQQHTAVVNELARLREKENVERLELERIRAEAALLETARDNLATANDELQHTLDRHKANVAAITAAKIRAEQELEIAVNESDVLKGKNAA